MSEIENPVCPECKNANHVVLVSTAQKAGTAIGGVAGAAGVASGYLGVESGAVTGGLVFSFAPVVGTGIGIIAGGLAGALAGFFAGAAVGNKVGEHIDRHVIRTYRCNKCGTEFEV